MPSDTTNVSDGILFPYIGKEIGILNNVGLQYEWYWGLSGTI
ncbi:hypothetical protein NEICINOT_04367 [Neisseria cinerea ATCC 14685]|uniref:Uncharacterized protein n=1 Tax=Neisseria cinerea ATCC 14685 TaxID=546262 RepID=D0W3X6_NEICI|nr:hypothetical protein NEICINOT_04367 [Neisseria cinerea ATCC 14685]